MRIFRRRDQVVKTCAFFLGLCLAAVGAVAEESPEPTPLAGTKLLEAEGDIASEMVAGVDRFLIQQIDRVTQDRRQVWAQDVNTPTERTAFLKEQRGKLARMLGAQDKRIPRVDMQRLERVGENSFPLQAEGYTVYAVEWPVLPFPGPSWSQSASLHGRGLLLIPSGKIHADVIALPDADQSPEALCGLVPGVRAESQFPRRLAENGCRVLVPLLVSRAEEKRNGRANLTHREYLYRSAFVLGRHLIGYEVQAVLAGVDWFQQTQPDADERPTVVAGYGEGGMLALYAAALDERIDAVGVAGYVAPRRQCWREPLSRNVFGRLRDFGDAELLAMILPRKVVVDSRVFPEVELKGNGGAPAKLTAPFAPLIQRELNLASLLAQRLRGEQPDGTGTIPHFEPPLQQNETPPNDIFTADVCTALIPATAPCTLKDSVPKLQQSAEQRQLRMQRHVAEIDRHNQWLLRESPYIRAEFMKELKTDSIADYEKSVEPYRDIFRDDVIGHFALPMSAPNPRTRLKWQTDNWQGYEVQLDVFPDVFAYGVLLFPRDIKPGERRPVVVCQHGLEGRPTDTFLGDHRAYHNYAARLADRGFVVFCPQNLYLFQDRFRTLQRKANTIGCTLFSVIVPQHQQITDWLGTLAFVDKTRIGFYGLSYGGKSAMRIPALVKNYALSICSADFNEWVWKNASTRAKYSYVWTGEYEIFEFNLGSTFNYAEMAALIAPRPFMVERGHFDGVGSDEQVAYEFAKVRHLYQARLGIGDRCEIEWFPGPHTINGQGTFDFLHRHLKWPKK